MSYPAWPDWTEEQWRQARQSIAKFDEAKHPRDKEGQFTDSAMSTPVLKGVDATANAVEQTEEHLKRWEVLTGVRPSPEELQAAEAELRALPLVHGTTVAGALGAVDTGLLSHADMVGEMDRMVEMIGDVKDHIENIVGDEVPWGEATFWQEDDVEALGLDRSDAKALLGYLKELQDIEKVITGTTYEPDTALGLDQFVFMTHGAKHQDYGDVAVIIDNEVLDTGFATEHDIVATPGVQTTPEWKEYEGVEAYQKTIVQGDGYYKTAAAKAGTVKGLANRSREQLFEIKVPRVPKGAVRGFVVTDLDTAQRLADKLAARRLTNRVLYIEDANSSYEKQRFLRQQMRHIQETGQWDEGAVDAFREEHEGVYLL